MSSTDSRGVRRGGCNCSQCDCGQYDGGTEGMKCNYCDHPPGKHVNMNTGIASLAPTTRSALFIPSAPVMDTDDTVFPSSQSQPLFDLNTGVDLQDDYCPQFTDHSVLDLDQPSSSMSMSPQGAVLQGLKSMSQALWGRKQSPVKRTNTASSQVFRSPAPPHLARTLCYHFRFVKYYFLFI